MFSILFLNEFSFLLLVVLFLAWRDNLSVYFYRAFVRLALCLAWSAKLCPTFRLLNKITFFYLYILHPTAVCRKEPPQRSFIWPKHKEKNCFSRPIWDSFPLSYSLLFARHKNTFLRNFILIFYEQNKKNNKLPLFYFFFLCVGRSLLQFEIQILTFWLLVWFLVSSTWNFIWCGKWQSPQIPIPGFPPAPPAACLQLLSADIYYFFFL